MHLFPEISRRMLTTAIVTTLAFQVATAQPALQLRKAAYIRDDSSRFSYVQDAVLGPGGLLYLVARSGRQILVYDSAGRFQRAFGNTGSGPGEFRGMSSIGWAGTNLWVADPRLRRISLFSSTGAVIRTVLGPDRSPGSRPLVPIALLADESAVLVASVNTPSLASDVALRTPFLRLHPSGRLDTLFAQSLPRLIQVHKASMITFVSQPFDEKPLARISKDGTWWLTGSVAPAADRNIVAVRLIVTRLNGTQAFSTVVEFPKLRIPQSMVDSIVTSVGNETAKAEVRQHLNVPEYLPPIADVKLGMDGSVWLKAASPSSSAKWIGIDRTGRRLGSFSLSARAEILAISSQVIWVSETDADDLAVVTRYALEQTR